MPGPPERYRMPQTQRGLQHHGAAQEQRHDGVKKTSEAQRIERKRDAEEHHRGQGDEPLCEAFTVHERDGANAPTGIAADVSAVPSRTFCAGASS